MSCQYKDIFGKSGQGIHSIRIFNIAVVDMLLTILAAVLIGKYFRLNVKGMIWVFAVLLLMSLVIHEAFCVDTTLTKLLCQKI